MQDISVLLYLGRLNLADQDRSVHFRDHNRSLQNLGYTAYSGSIEIDIIAAMDTSYLSTQVSTISAQLHALFDEIGVSDQDRETRETEVGLSCPPIQ
jgi:hypothetical protein